MPEENSKKEHNFPIWSWKRWEFFLASVMIIAAVWAVSPPSAVVHHDESLTHYNDFIYYRVAGETIKNAPPSNVYNSKTQYQKFKEIIHSTVEITVPYLYPPQSLFFFLPLAYFSLDHAFYLWQVVNIVATLLLLFMLRFANIYTKKPGNFLLSALLITSCYPWIVNIFQAQVVIISTVGLLGYHILTKHKHFTLAGMLIVMTAFKPQLFMAPVLYLLILHGKPLWYSTIAASLAVIAICSAVFGISIWDAYLTTIFTASDTTYSLKASESFGDDVFVMGNIRTLLLMILGEAKLPIVNIISGILWFSSAIMAIGLAVILKNKTEKIQDLGFGLSIVMACLLSPWLHSHSFILFVIPLIYLVKYIEFKPTYMYVGSMVNFGLLSMFTGELVPHLNPILWVTAQILLMTFIGYHLHKANKTNLEDC